MIKLSHIMILVFGVKSELEIVDIQKQRADIDYIALMSGIDLEA